MPAGPASSSRRGIAQAKFCAASRQIGKTAHRRVGAIHGIARYLSHLPKYSASRTSSIFFQAAVSL